MNAIETVGQLRKYLRDRRKSPEQFARALKISNMTIRRLLAKSDSHPIPEKYRNQLNQAVIEPLANFKDLMTDLASQGAQVVDAASLRQRLDAKLETAKLDEGFLKKISIVAKAAFGKTKATERALCIGALLYLINPIDLIPDTMGAIGYLDDFAVITMVCETIRRKSDTAADTGSDTEPADS